ncbi:MAG: hypothetical protein JWQ49_1979 [Edaphobacter sp.]|nr:hypothetical protein [Edaphobacter sp.]
MESGVQELTLIGPCPPMALTNVFCDVATPSWLIATSLSSIWTVRGLWVGEAEQWRRKRSACHRERWPCRCWIGSLRAQVIFATQLSRPV